VGVLVICIPVFIVFLYCVFVLFRLRIFILIYSVCTSVKDCCHRVTTQMQAAAVNGGGGDGSSSSSSSSSSNVAILARLNTKRKLLPVTVNTHYN